MLTIADKFRIKVDKYGYIIEEHIISKPTHKNNYTSGEYWGNAKYPSTLANARKYIIERAEKELFENDEYIQFANAVDKMEQLKREVMELSVIEEEKRGKINASKS